MKRLFILILFGVGAVPAMAAPSIPDPEAQEMDVDITAKILKEKAKRNTMPKPGGNVSSETAGTGDGGSKCSININSNNVKKGSVKDILGNKSTTIITGDVINMNNNCK